MARCASICFALLAITLPKTAWGWVEAHVISNETRIAIDANGDATVEHKTLVRVTGGPLRTFEIMGVDPDAEPLPEGFTRPDAGGDPTSPVAVEIINPDASVTAMGLSTLVAKFEGRGLGRGTHLVSVRYRSHFLGRKLIRRNDALAEFSWVGPAFQDGFDRVRTTVELPAAPTEPRAAPSGGTSLAETAVLRRGPMRDALDLVRPYSPQGERLVWTVLFDPRAIVGLDREDTEPKEPVGISQEARTTLAFLAGLGLFSVFSLLVSVKMSEVERKGRHFANRAAPLIPMPILLRAPLAGMSLVLGVWLEWTQKTPTAGAALVCLAAALSAHRVPDEPRRKLRGPGKWLPMLVEDVAKAQPPMRCWLDASTSPGRLVFLSIAALLISAALFVSRTSAYHGWIIALDSVPVLSLFLTGRASTFVPDGLSASSRLLRRVHVRLMRAGIRSVFRVRIPNGEVDADELRLTALVPNPEEGLLAIEIGGLLTRGAFGFLVVPELLIRFRAGTDCERAVRRLIPRQSIVRGRTKDERVATLAPRLPTAQATAALTRALVRALASPARPADIAEQKAA